MTSRRNVGILSVSAVVVSLSMSLGIAGTQVPASSPATVSQPSPTPSVEERLKAIEGQVDSLTESGQDPQKDVWDKIDSISGLVSGGLIAFIGLAATYVFRERQRAAEEARSRQEVAVQEAMTVVAFLPYLQSGDEKAKEAALLALAGLGNSELATNLAGLYGSEGAISALAKIASGPDRAARQQAEESLENVLRMGSIESQALRKLRQILEEVEDPSADIPDHVFVSGSYGYNVWRTELAAMVRKGWVQVVDNKIRITEDGKRAAGGE